MRLLPLVVGASVATATTCIISTADASTATFIPNGVAPAPGKTTLPSRTLTEQHSVVAEKVAPHVPQDRQQYGLGTRHVIRHLSKETRLRQDKVFLRATQRNLLERQSQPAEQLPENPSKFEAPLIAIGDSRNHNPGQDSNHSAIPGMLPTTSNRQPNSSPPDFPKAYPHPDAAATARSDGPVVPIALAPSTSLVHRLLLVIAALVVDLLVVAGLALAVPIIIDCGKGVEGRLAQYLAYRSNKSPVQFSEKVSRHQTRPRTFITSVKWEEFPNSYTTVNEATPFIDPHGT